MKIWNIWARSNFIDTMHYINWKASAFVSYKFENIVITPCALLDESAKNVILLFQCAILYRNIYFQKYGVFNLVAPHLNLQCVCRVPVWVTLVQWYKVQRFQEETKLGKMEETKLSNPLFVFKKLLVKNFILSLSLLTLHKILKPLWIDSWSLCSTTVFLLSISASGNWFGISWLFDKNFYNLISDALSFEITVLVILVKSSTEFSDFKVLSI